MARGFESKSVESQQSEELDLGRPRLPAAERERLAKLESLEMQRTRIVRDLENARSETHRVALENALRFLDDEIAKQR